MMIVVEVGRVVMSLRCLVCRCADAAIVQTQYTHGYCANTQVQIGDERRLLSFSVPIISYITM